MTATDTQVITVTTENYQAKRALYPSLGLHTLTKGTSLRYDPDNDRLVCFVTQVADIALGRDVEVGWDLCGRCHSFVGLCQCTGGASLPSYIVKWNGEPPAGWEVAKPATPAPSASVRDLYPDGYKAPVRNPVTGRKQRADKGIKRGAKTRMENSAHQIEQRYSENGSPARTLAGPCAMHTAESKRHPDGTYECTVPGCQGIQ